MSSKPIDNAKETLYIITMIEYESERSSADLIYHQYNDVLESGAHFHSNFEFIYVFDGSQVVHINKKVFVLKKGNAVLILPGEVHWYENTPGSSSYLCIFSGNYIPEFVKQLNNHELKDSSFEFAFSNLFVKAENELYIKAFLYIVAACAIKGGIQKSSHSEENNLIYRVTDYISRNYKNEITLKDIANEFGYNYTYLSNLFNLVFPDNFVKVINKYRINHAKKLLKESNFNITAISMECGFPSIRTFNRVFKEFENVSPRSYRSMLQ